MKKSLLKQTTIAIILTICTAAGGAIAQTPQLKTSNLQVRRVLDRIRTKAASLKTTVARENPNNSTTDPEDRVANQLTALTNAANSLRTVTYNRNADPETDLNAILDRGSRINRILSRNQTSNRTTTEWTALRADINTLAGYYGMSWDWNENNAGNNNNGPYAGSLTGTYRLDQSKSDNVSDVVERSMKLYTTTQRDRMRQNLERRLASPQIIVIDKNGRNITLGSSNQAEVTFEADGVGRTETNNRGRTITTRVTASGNDSLTIDYSGDRVNDFNVMFSVDRRGDLKVTRRIYLENRNDTITVSSVYDRTSQVADFSNVRGSNNTNSGGVIAGDFYVPNGTTLTATLRNAVTTKASQVGDRFTMDVTSPYQYRGAVIEGRVTQASGSGRVSGRANVQLDFDTISYQGRTYRFAGLIQTVNATNGDNVSVNNEGGIKDSNQTTKTATRAGIGAVLGAIIGAVAGGGSGAAIGAGVGAGAGAGTVLLGGRDSIELGTGSTFTILSTSPGNIPNPRN